MAQFKIGQWVFEIDEANQAYEIYNPDPDGKKRFFRVVPGAYSAPMIEAEPDRAFDCPGSLAYVDAKGQPATPGQKIGGIICQGGLRASLTNALSKGIVIQTNDDGSIQIGDETWWVATLFLKDKNHVRNYDAYCVKEQPAVVRVLELEDLNLFG